MKELLQNCVKSDLYWVVRELVDRVVQLEQQVQALTPKKTAPIKRKRRRRNEHGELE